jgi:dihydrofolate synthase/folylpolyglutamate synthase
MNYAEAISHLHALAPELPPSVADSTPRRKFDLAHMRRLCAELGNPQDKLPAVLIAGTNGKGSTSATLASILTAAGYRTGLYTSPHLTRVNERIQLARESLALTPIADADFAQLYTLVDEVARRLVEAGQLPHPPSFFERLTAIAFSFFAGIDRPNPTPRAEIVVLEVGLGGRLDATNIVEPLLSVLTDIALDHQDYLGDTIPEIAREKCGILRQNGILVTLSQHPEANQAIGEAAVRLNVRGVNAAGFLPPARRNPARRNPDGPQAPAPWRNRYKLPVEGLGLLAIDSPLAGDHQQRNIALALAAALELRNTFGYKIEARALEDGVRQTSWPGRLEWLTPQLLLDVAHNPAGAWTLRSAISALPESLPRTLLFSCLRDKDLREMARILFPLFDSASDGELVRARDHIVLAPIPNPRAAAVEDLLAVASELGIHAHSAADVPSALRLAHELTPAGGVIVATGSVYLVGEVRGAALAPSEVLV